MSLVVRFAVEGTSKPISVILFFFIITESSFERESVMLFTWMGNEKDGRKGVMKRRNEGIGNILINVR